MEKLPQPYKQPFIYVADFLPLTGGTGVSYTDFEFKIDLKSNFELLRIIHIANDDRINVKLYNGTTGRYFFQPQADIRDISGTAFSGITPNGFIPYQLPIPLKLSAGTELVLSASDKSGSNNNLRTAMYGNHLYGGEAPWIKRKLEKFDIPINFGVVGAYQSASKTVVLENKAGYLVTKIGGIRTGSCLVYITSGEKPWMSRAVHFDNLCGNGQFGNALTTPKWIKEKSTITFNVMDLSGSSNTISLTLNGARAYV